MLAKKEIFTLIALFCLFFLLFQTTGCKKDDYIPGTIQGENESEIPLPENNSVSDSCADVTGLAFSSVSYLANPQYPNGYSVCQDECIDLDTDEGAWKAYNIYTGDDWCSDSNSNTENPTYIHCCAYCPQETHYCPISKSCVSDSSPEQGLQWKLECPYITLSWDKDEKAISYEIILFYDENKDGIEDGKCEEDISNTKEVYFYYNLEPSDCASYYTGNVRFQIIPQYSDGLSIESYNTEWIDVSECNLGSNDLDPNLNEFDSCNQNKFKMVFILVARKGSELTFDRINKINNMKEDFSKEFYESTSNLAEMDTTYPLVTLIISEDLITNDDDIVLNKVMKKFYENHPDSFDFVTIYLAFETKLTYAYHHQAQNYIKGIGSLIFDNTKYYGSNGKLLGINKFGYIDKSSYGKVDFYRGLLHETGHQWCCYVGDNFANGENNAKLEIIQQSMHFYRGLQSPYKTGTPMNSDHWVPNGDGTYRRENKDGVQKYHPFQLYFMGLLPKSEYSTKHKVYNAGIISEDFNDQTAVFYKEVSVNDIITVEGERKCILK